MHPYDDKSYAPAELGASIFVDVNKNMWRAADEFNLTRMDFKDAGDGQMGVWNGKQFLLTVSCTSDIYVCEMGVLLPVRPVKKAPSRRVVVLVSLINPFGSIGIDDRQIEVRLWRV